MTEKFHKYFPAIQGAEVFILVECDVRVPVQAHAVKSASLFARTNTICECANFLSIHLQLHIVLEHLFSFHF